MHNELFNRVSELMKAKEHFRATQMLKPIIEENPDDPYLYYLMGLVWKDAEVPNIAVVCFSNSLNLKPNNPPVLLALGIAQQLNGQLEEAVRTLERLIRLNPDIPESYNSLGMTYKKMDRLTDAAHWYDEGLQCLVRQASAEAERRDPSVASQVIGNDVYFNPQLMDKSHRILKSTPHYTIMSNNLGICLVALGDIEGAKNCVSGSD